MLCANLADPALVGAARSCGPTTIGTAGMSAGHGPPPATRGCGVVPGLSVGHGPLRAIRGRGLAAAATPGLSAGHGPLHAVRSRGPAAVAGLRWTCGPDSSTGGQQQTAWPVPGGGVHNSHSTSRRSVLQDVHEELQGGELHRHQWLSGGSQGP